MKNLSDQPCLIARSLALVGDAWSMLIMRDAHAGSTRFDEFRKNLGIAPTPLATRLAAMTEEGLLQKRRYSERPPRDEYVLTDAGRDFLPVLFALAAWGAPADRASNGLPPGADARDFPCLRAPRRALAQALQMRSRHTNERTETKACWASSGSSPRWPC